MSIIDIASQPDLVLPPKPEFFPDLVPLTPGPADPIQPDLVPHPGPAALPAAMDKLLADLARRKKAAEKDSSMLGDSGFERNEADFYPTPPENVDVLLRYMSPIGSYIWEPACGDGAISKRLMDRGFETWSSDLHDYGFGTPGMDFLAQTKAPRDDIRCIVTNPPYADLAEKFARHAIKLMEPVKGQVAMFLRNEFDCGKGRMDLFGLPPFAAKIVVTKRPRWIEGSTGSPRHNYAWFIWDWRHIKGPAAVFYAHPNVKPSLAQQ